MLQVGSNGPLVAAWQQTMLRRFKGYALESDGGPLRVDAYFGYSDRDVQKEYERRTGQTVDGIVSDADLAALGLQDAPKPKPRHAALVFRGTGGIIGQDYVSRVCQQAGDLVEEFNPDWPASMGGLPPGAPGTPSMLKASDIAFDAGCRWIEANPTRTIVLGGYSAGCHPAARLRQALLEPGGRLERFRDNYVCSFSIGDPTRPFGGSYYLGPVLAGVGISSWRYGDPKDYRHAWLTHPGDMYGNIPVPIPGGTGDLMETVYDIVVQAGMTDFLGTVQRMIPHLIELLQDSGVLATAAGLGPVLLNPVAAVPLLLPILVQALPGLIAGVGGGVGGELTGPAAAVQAAIIGMRFLLSGTRDHISYHVDEVWPGQTYLGLAVQHVRDWAARVPVRS